MLSLSFFAIFCDFVHFNSHVNTKQDIRNGVNAREYLSNIIQNEENTNQVWADILKMISPKETFLQNAKFPRWYKILL